MSRPSHAMQQVQLDDALAAPTGQRWRWLFTPDPRWLNTVNTTSLRTVNAIRMFILVTLTFVVMFVGVVGYAFTRCGITLKIASVTVFQLTPPPGKLSEQAWRLCEESLATARMLDFASEIFNTYSLLLAAMAGIALGAMAVKRATDTEHKVRVEEAKKAPIILPPPTGEHQAQAGPTNQTIVNVAGEPTAAPDTPKPATEPDNKTDDESGQ